MKIKIERSVGMKSKFKKAFFGGGLSMLLVFQPVLSYAALVELPKEKPLKYSEALLQRFEDLKICVMEAEAKIMEANATEGKTEENRPKTCSEVMEEYGLEKTSSTEVVDSKYWKDVTELEAAIDLFIKMGQEASDEDRQLKFEKVNDQWDLLFYRIFNMLYEIPKVQGHPLILEFAKESRDVFLKHGKFTYFRNICYYFYHNNPDKELTRDLLRFVYHLEESDFFMEIEDYVPDENSNVYLPGEVIPSPELPDDFVDPEEQEEQDLEQAWEETWEEIIQEEEKENPPVVIPSPKPIPHTETYTSYEVKGDVCTKVVSVVIDGVPQGTTQVAADASEAYHCGRLEDIGWDVEVEDEEVDSINLVVHYRYGEEEELRSTDISLVDPVFDYETLVDVLRIISSEHGAGSLGGKERYLFAIVGKPLILTTFEEGKSLEDVNGWLKSKKIPIELTMVDPSESEMDSIENK